MVFKASSNWARGTMSSPSGANILAKYSIYSPFFIESYRRRQLILTKTLQLMSESDSQPSSLTPIARKSKSCNAALKFLNGKGFFRMIGKGTRKSSRSAGVSVYSILSPDSFSIDDILALAFAGSTLSILVLRAFLSAFPLCPVLFVSAASFASVTASICL